MVEPFGNVAHVIVSIKKRQGDYIPKPTPNPDLPLVLSLPPYTGPRFLPRPPRLSQVSCSSQVLGLCVPSSWLGASNLSRAPAVL